jgi:hypothetical protein
MVLLEKGIRIQCAYKCLDCPLCVRKDGLDAYNPRVWMSENNHDDLDVKLNIFQLAEIFGTSFLSDQDVIRLQNFISLKYYKKNTIGSNESRCSLNELGRSMARLQQNGARGELNISSCLAEFDNSTGLPR